MLLLQRENPLFICLLLTIFDRMEVGSHSFAVDIPSKIVHSLKYHHSLLADTLVRIKKN